MKILIEPTFIGQLEMEIKPNFYHEFTIESDQFAEYLINTIKENRSLGFCFAYHDNSYSPVFNLRILK